MSRDTSIYPQPDEFLPRTFYGVREGIGDSFLYLWFRPPFRFATAPRWEPREKIEKVIWTDHVGFPFFIRSTQPRQPFT